MVRSANYVVVAADSSKVGREEFVVVGLVAGAEIDDGHRRQVPLRLSVVAEPRRDLTVAIGVVEEPVHHREPRIALQKLDEAEVGSAKRLDPCSGFRFDGLFCGRRRRVRRRRRLSLAPRKQAQRQGDAKECAHDGHDLFRLIWCGSGSKLDPSSAILLRSPPLRQEK